MDLDCERRVLARDINSGGSIPIVGRRDCRLSSVAVGAIAEVVRRMYVVGDVVVEWEGKRPDADAGSRREALYAKVVRVTCSVDHGNIHSGASREHRMHLLYMNIPMLFTVRCNEMKRDGV